MNRFIIILIKNVTDKIVQGMLNFAFLAWPVTRDIIFSSKKYIKEGICKTQGKHFLHFFPYYDSHHKYKV